MVGETGLDRVGAGHACARQAEIEAEAALGAREQICAADVGNEADRRFRHGDLRALGDDAVAGVRGQADAAAHDDAVHQGDVRFPIARDHGIEFVLLAPEGMGVSRATCTRVVQPTHVAARTERPIACAIEDHNVDRRIIRPGLQGDGNRLHHAERERVERLRPVECQAACASFAPHDHFICRTDRFGHRLFPGAFRLMAG